MAAADPADLLWRFQLRQDNREVFTKIRSLQENIQKFASEYGALKIDLKELKSKVNEPPDVIQRLQQELQIVSRLTENHTGEQACVNKQIQGQIQMFSRAIEGLKDGQVEFEKQFRESSLGLDVVQACARESALTLDDLTRKYRDLTSHVDRQLKQLEQITSENGANVEQSLAQASNAINILQKSSKLNQSRLEARLAALEGSLQAERQQLSILNAKVKELEARPYLNQGHQGVTSGSYTRQRTPRENASKLCTLTVDESIAQESNSGPCQKVGIANLPLNLSLTTGVPEFPAFGQSSPISSLFNITSDESSSRAEAGNALLEQAGRQLSDLGRSLGAVSSQVESRNGIAYSGQALEEPTVEENVCLATKSISSSTKHDNDLKASDFRALGPNTFERTPVGQLYEPSISLPSPHISRRLQNTLNIAKVGRGKAEDANITVQSQQISLAISSFEENQSRNIQPSSDTKLKENSYALKDSQKVTAARNAKNLSTSLTSEGKMDKTAGTSPRIIPQETPKIEAKQKRAIIYKPQSSPIVSFYTRTKSKASQAQVQADPQRDPKFLKKEKGASAIPKPQNSVPSSPSKGEKRKCKNAPLQPQTIVRNNPGHVENIQNNHYSQRALLEGTASKRQKLIQQRASYEAPFLANSIAESHRQQENLSPLVSAESKARPVTARERPATRAGTLASKRDADLEANLAALPEKLRKTLM